MRSRDEGPYFDDLSVGDVLETAPSTTLTQGRAAVHQSILGSRLRLPLDEHLSRAVTGSALADPSFVWDVAIGQSTQVTRRVIANLFYRGLAFHRATAIGDTLHTRTEVVGLRQNSSRPSGLAALRVTTRDQEDRVVLDFWRCAMLPLSSPTVQTGHADDLDSIGGAADFSAIATAVAGWDLDRLPFSAAGSIAVGDAWELHAGDVVSSAPELARLTLNLARVHHDGRSQPTGRLVYGGHTIGLALAQVTKTLPDLITVAGWHGCDHTGPVHEGDTLASAITVESVDPAGDRLRLVHLRVRVLAHRAQGADEVLDWRPVLLSR
ncbi:MAG: MaoC domain protein dehydratase [Marmoricola sp.]|nr:MaoC domain protein dehydratase [Marmoricola sp.]